MLLNGAISVNQAAWEATNKKSVLFHVLKWAGVSAGSAHGSNVD
jgi:hypothetical protein